MTNLQLSSIISQAMFVGSAYEKAKDDKDFDEVVFRNYARGMMTVLLRELNLYNEDIIEKSVKDFSAMHGF
tara:strand:- start:3 stop:215 length:213 start_codon:yes stop_codon:yes gene_type:complete